MTLKMTSTQVVEMSVIVNYNSSFQNYTNPGDHTWQTNLHIACNFILIFFLYKLVCKTCQSPGEIFTNKYMEKLKRD